MLADLAGKHPVGEFDATATSTTPVRVAAQLRAFRGRQTAASLDESARIAAKRDLARLAPAGLRELLRRL